MKWTLTLILGAVFCNMAFTCVIEDKISGYELKNLDLDYEVRVEVEDGIFKKLPFHNLNSPQFYNVQILKKEHQGDWANYNKKYLPYYDYQRMKDYLTEVTPALNNFDYELKTIGQSLKGRDLYYIGPKNLDPNKQTIVMFGRHHGDEGTANWIIEGFVNHVFNFAGDFHERFQVLLYPMINPDGVEKMSRYNSKDRDLNRAWSKSVSKSKDEAKVINTHLQEQFKSNLSIPVVLDMHGSFTEDFIYRVKKSFISTEFYNVQQDFIDTLGLFDLWQKGYSKKSNGNSKMARIVLVDHFGLNALTHETPRDIKIKNPSGRTLDTLKRQGRDIFEAILKIY